MLKVGDFEIHWLDGGSFELDGGAMFGVVPKVLWEKKFPTSTANNIFMVASPMLVRTGKNNVMIDTGLGNKMTEKQLKIYNVRSPWRVHESLERLGMKAADVDTVILTHCDYDHAAGLLEFKGGEEPFPTYPNARVVVQKKEWEDVRNPNRRSIHSFWEINFRGVEESGKLVIADGEMDVVEGIRVRHTGGHNRGHQAVEISSKGETAFHLGDLLPSHVHFNPLWVMAYDNYPMEVIDLKENYEKEALQKDAWIMFYHDPRVRACKFDEKGNLRESLSAEELKS